MKTTARFLTGLLLGMSAAASSYAQVITLADTKTGVVGTSDFSSIGFATGGAVVETMAFPTLVSPTFASFSWYFTSSGGSPVNTGPNTVQFYLSEWSAGAIVGSQLWTSGSVSLGSYGASADIPFSPNILLNASKTYALSVVALNFTSSNIKNGLAATGAGQVNTTNKFPFGRAFVANGDNGDITSFTSLKADTFSTQGGAKNDWVFSSFRVDSLSPVPETGTVAVAFAGVLLVGLGVRRRMAAKSKTVATVA